MRRLLPRRALHAYRGQLRVSQIQAGRDVRQALPRLEHRLKTIAEILSYTLAIAIIILLLLLALFGIKSLWFMLF